MCLKAPLVRFPCCKWLRVRCTVCRRCCEHFPSDRVRTSDVKKEGARNSLDLKKTEPVGDNQAAARRLWFPRLSAGIRLPVRQPVLSHFHQCVDRNPSQPFQFWTAAVCRHINTDESQWNQPPVTGRRCHRRRRTNAGGAVSPRPS